MVPGILGGLLVLIALVVIVISVIAGKNVRAMDSCIDAVLEEFRTEYTVTLVYLTVGKDFPLLTEEQRSEKLAITEEYTDGLIEKGGISTDIFKKELGNRETKKFFDKVFFGTAA